MAHTENTIRGGAKFVIFSTQLGGPEGRARALGAPLCMSHWVVKSFRDNLLALILKAIYLHEKTLTSSKKQGIVRAASRKVNNFLCNIHKQEVELGKKESIMEGVPHFTVC